MINFDKFLASFITEMKKYQPITCYNLPGCIKKALKDQEFEYKDGEIVRISAESEDERIKKSLIDGFKRYDDGALFNGCLVREILPWLENQGEQKSVIIIPKFRVGDEVITENEESLTITRIDEEGYWSNDLFICDFDEECDWDLVEQKPIEWKQENREELTEFENAMMHIGGSFFGKNAGLDPNDTAAIKEQAELLLELAPKTEWSEEDEKRVESCLNILQPKTLLGNNVETINTKWLKSLKYRIQPIQEWSEEDEDMIQALNACIDAAIKSGMNYISFGSKSILIEKVKNQLKSLKGRVRLQNLTVTDEEIAQAKRDAYNDALDKNEYHSGEPTFDDGWSAAILYLKKRNAMLQSQWKPSDEQMEALEHFIIHHNGSTNYAKDLKELRIQLKELKGEQAMTLQQILSKAISEWGIEAQTDLAIEEMGELIVAINHYRRGRVGMDSVQEEIADVMIAMKQLAMIYGELGVDKFIEQKTQRLEQRLKIKQ